jgi:hypothetical protein
VKAQGPARGDTEMTASGALTAGTVAVALVLTFGLVRYSRRLWPPDGARAQVRFFGTYSPVMTWLTYRRWLNRPMDVARQWWRVLPRATLLELAAIVVWAAWVGRIYLTLDTMRWLPGGDWALNLEGYFPWTWFSQCGLCVLWNGSINGGSPAFVELVAAVLHPVWIVSILLYGVVNASKVAVVAAFVMAGWAQWWLAKTLRLGMVTRLWSAALVVVGGHLAGRLDNGLVEELFPLSAASLALAAAFYLAVTGRRRAVALFGITLGLSLLSGLSYYQIGLIVCIFPGLLFFCFTSRLQRRPLLKSFIVGGLIGVLISSVLLVPLLHFWPNFVKPTSDPSYVNMQPLAQLVSNLVIADRGYYGTLESLGLPGSAAWFANYIGWLPLLLAVVGLRVAPRRWLPVVLFAVSGIILVYLMGSALLLKWAAPYFPAVLNLRTPSVMTGLAVPLIVLLAAIGLNAIWNLNWPGLLLKLSNQSSPMVSLRWVLLVPLLWSVRSAYDSAKQYFALVDAPLENYAVIGSTGLAGKQWIELPYGEAFLNVVGLQSGLKQTNVLRPWDWRDRTAPDPYSELTRQQPAGDSQTAQFGLYYVKHPDVNYASITQAAGPVACDGSSLGGNIDVTCQSNADGQLTVMENAWSGWQVWRDGVKVQLTPGRWLSTYAPAGIHHYIFRYLPWDVALGALLAIVGVVWAAWLLLKRGGTRSVQAAAR